MTQTTAPVRPVVGVCARAAPVELQGTPMVVSLALQTHISWLADAGCNAVILPLQPGVEQLVDRLDGLLIPGGPDLDPGLYNEPAHPMTLAPSAAADRIELQVVRAALEAGLPVLGICRGMQLLNVTCGGTLHQHLADVPGRVSHRPSSPAVDFARHRVQLREGSQVAQALGGRSTESACHHHQAINALGSDVVATGVADDGTVEVIELSHHPFAVGIQWEAGQTADQRLHLALAEAAALRAYASSRTRHALSHAASP